MSNTPTLRAKHERRKLALKTVRNRFEEHWVELADNVAPNRLRLQLNADQGKKTRSKIVDTTGVYDLRTLKSGMHSGITSPARPWFRLTTPDPDLKEYGPVKDWLAHVDEELRGIFQASNIYNAFHTGYGDLGLFGQSAALLVEDERRVLRMIQLLHGSFWIARDHLGRATTLCREFSWSCERIIARFGLDRVSRQVRQCYDRGDYDEVFTINHLVEPRRDREHGKIDKRNKPWASNYWEEGSRPENDIDGTGMLEVSGFDDNPIIAPPWELIGEDHYGHSPGMEVLPDVKSLHIMQTRFLEAVDKKVRPPMTGPASMKGTPASLLPGSITYVDDPTGKAYRSAIEVNISLAELETKITQMTQRVDRGFYADLFMMLTQMEGIQPRNVMELAERKEEKLLALGPVLESVHGDQLSPVIDRSFTLALRAGRIKPPPQEIQGQDLKIDYISILAQAQKAVATGSMERFAAFVGNHAAIKPEVLDKYDADQAVDLYADYLGVPPSIVVSDDKVTEIRSARVQANQEQARQQQMIAAAPAMQQTAQAAELLSRTDTGNAASLLSKIGIA